MLEVKVRGATPPLLVAHQGGLLGVTLQQKFRSRQHWLTLSKHEIDLNITVVLISL